MPKKNPVHYRLVNFDNDVVGTMRVTTEYIAPAGDRWQLEPIPCDRDATVRLDKPPFGIDAKKRPLLGRKKKENTE